MPLLFDCELIVNSWLQYCMILVKFAGSFATCSVALFVEEAVSGQASKPNKKECKRLLF